MNEIELMNVKKLVGCDDFDEFEAIGWVGRILKSGFNFKVDLNKFDHSSFQSLLQFLKIIIFLEKKLQRKLNN
jgi:hypothetical protein